MGIDVKLTLSDEVLAYLQQEATRRQVALDEVISDVLTDYFDEPTHAKLLTSLQRSFEQVTTGDYRPARAFLDELDDEATDDADNS